MFILKLFRWFFVLQLLSSGGSIAQKDITSNDLNSGHNYTIPLEYFYHLLNFEGVLNPEVPVQYDIDSQFSGYQLWKLHTLSVQHKVVQTLMAQGGGEIWNVNQDGVDLFFDSSAVKNAKEFMESTDVTYNIMIDNMVKAISDTYGEVNITRDAKDAPWLYRNDSSMSWNKYHDATDINNFLFHILEKYDGIAQIITVGRTELKRNIKVLKISNGKKHNPAIFIEGGLQARDWISPAAVTYIISKLLSNWDQKPDFLKNIDWYFLPMANPDGYQYSFATDRLWVKNRKRNPGVNCRGVNVDRNFAYGWDKKGSSPEPCDDVYRGEKSFSEPESKAIRNALLHIGDKLVAYISIGGYGQVITYPWGDKDFTTDNEREVHAAGKQAVLNIRQLDQSEYRVGPSYRLKRTKGGNSADWVQFAHNPEFVYSMYLQDQGRYGYLLPPDYILPSSMEAYELVKTVANSIATLGKPGYLEPEEFYIDEQGDDDPLRSYDQSEDYSAEDY